ncbi:Fatty acid-binding -like protein 6 [Trichinella spiralis]|uniref:Fatty acid-binding-like protein 6 n=1 Tax=Trichinella spiralis TaxID=6334 RepID=A0A0V1B8M9_TRISP|nr:Fatty acid-binding -like protein 6 [Trichinella spiralis]
MNTEAAEKAQKTKSIVDFLWNVIRFSNAGIFFELIYLYYEVYYYTTFASTKRNSSAESGSCMHVNISLLSLFAQQLAMLNQQKKIMERVDFATRKIASALSPTVEIIINGNVWTIKTMSTFKSEEAKFELNKEIELTTMDGRNIKMLCTLENGRLIQKQMAMKAGDKDTEIIREINGNEMLTWYDNFLKISNWKVENFDIYLVQTKAYLLSLSVLYAEQSSQRHFTSSNHGLIPYACLHFCEDAFPLDFKLRFLSFHVCTIPSGTGSKFHPFSNENSIIHFEYLDAQPNPLPFPGRMRLLLRANVSRSPPDRVNVRLFLRKYLIKSGWVRLPCLSGFGSCLYICLLTSDLFGCPVEPMYYNINDSFMLNSVDFAPRIAPKDLHIFMANLTKLMRVSIAAAVATAFNFLSSNALTINNSLFWLNNTQRLPRWPFIKKSCGVEDTELSIRAVVKLGHEQQQEYKFPYYIYANYKLQKYVGKMTILSVRHSAIIVLKFNDAICVLQEQCATAIVIRIASILPLKKSTVIIDNKHREQSVVCQTIIFQGMKFQSSIIGDNGLRNWNFVFLISQKKNHKSNFLET